MEELQWGFPIATPPFEQAAPNKLLVKGRIRMGTGLAPADLHPPLNKTKVAKALVENINPG
jgi:hypothetical protein